MQLEATSSYPFAHYLGEQTGPHVTTTSFQVYGGFSAFPGRTVSISCNICCCQRCLPGVHSVRWLKDKRTAIVRSSIWRWGTPKMLGYNYCHPSFLGQKAYRLYQLARMRTLRGIHLLALKIYMAAKAQEKELKG